MMSRPTLYDVRPLQLPVDTIKVFAIGREDFDDHSESWTLIETTAAAADRLAQFSVTEARQSLYVAPDGTEHVVSEIGAPVQRQQDVDQEFVQKLRDNQEYLFKTVGVFDLIQQALEPLADKIEVAFIYGSFAQSTELVSSDVDLLVVGNLILADIAIALRTVQRKINREINPVVFRVNKARNKLLDGDHFLLPVQKSTKFF